MSGDENDGLATTPPQRLNPAGLADAAVHPRRVETRRLAASTRTLLRHLVRTAASVEEIAAIADDLDAIAERIASLPSRSVEGYAEVATSGDPHAVFDDSPLIGLSNPIAPPLSVEIFDDHVVATVTMTDPYEGPPNCVHGGFVAAIFDEVLGIAQSMSGSPGMTANLDVNYRSPTPLHHELKFTGRLDRIDGRKIYASGQCHHGDTLTAEATGLFISLDLAKLEQLREGW